MKKLLNWLKWKLKITPGWKECRLASCWDGANASKRMMNILSPGMSEDKFKSYVKWMEGRGCDTVHCFLINQADGENAGYNCATDGGAQRVAKARIDYLRKRGFAVVLWIIADDSARFAADLFRNAEAYCARMADAGLFDHASYVVLGLEMDEYGNRANWTKLRSALLSVWKGKIGVHHTSGNSFPYADLGDIILGQLDPKTATETAIKNQIARIQAKGKAAVGFEYSRNPDRQKATWALDAGAIGVGNW